MRGMNAKIPPSSIRRVSADGLDFIRRYERFSGKTYTCPAGRPTIGYGHVIKPGERFPETITVEQASRLLARDLDTIEIYLSALFPAAPQHQFDALASFAFNCGLGALDRSTLLKMLRQGDMAGAADQFLRWDKVGGQPLAGLTRRRQDERALFLGLGRTA